MHRLLFILVFLWSWGKNIAQEATFSPHSGAQVGISIQWGTNLQRLGLSLQIYHSQAHWQASSALRWHYQWRALGNPQTRPEWQITLGLLGSYGPRDHSTKYLFHVLNNQTAHRHSLAYAHHWYLDRLTRQRSGTVALQFGALEIITENDALSGEGQDKYRTGALQIAWRDGLSRWALNTVLWTGNTHGPLTRRVRDSGSYNCRYGYKDISEGHCGRFSHGIFAVAYQRHLGYGQRVGIQLGLDSERVRHLLQNRFIHDMPFIPARWVKVENPHIPMLDSEGQPYLFQSQQELRPTRFYFQLSANESLFY